MTARRTRAPRPDRCRSCDRLLVVRPRGSHAAAVPDGHVIHDSHGMCSGCRSAQTRIVIGQRSEPQRTTEQMLDGWALLRRQGDYSVAEAARAMGVRHRTLEAALRVARLREDLRAVPGRDTRYRAKPKAHPGSPWAHPKLFDPNTADEGEQT